MKHSSRLKLLFGPQEISSRIRELGGIISQEYGDGPLLCVCVLKGASLFFADLVRAMPERELIFDFMTLSSYHGGLASSGKVKLIGNLRERAEGRRVLIVEDIVDSGLTAEFLTEHFHSLNAAEVRLACLIDKPEARKNDYIPDYAAFKLNSKAFIVGFGMDCAEIYRNLDGIYELT